MSVFEGTIFSQFAKVLDIPSTNNLFTLSGNVVIDGNDMYGMSESGGANSVGCIYKIRKDGSGYKVIHDFQNQDGRCPVGSLVLYHDTLFGATRYGGKNAMGCVFRLHKNGTGYIRIFDFTQYNGYSPQSSLILYNGSLYGVCSSGGTNFKGIIYKIRIADNAFTCLRNFSSADGVCPYGVLTESDGILYGLSGGAYFDCSIYSIKPDGSELKIIYISDIWSSISIKPSSYLIIYGDVFYGEFNDNLYSRVFKVNKNGSGYQKIREFAYNETDFSLSGSVLIYNDLIYGMTSDGDDDRGAIFSISKTGSNYKKIYNFGGMVYGKPRGGLLASNDTLYGVTEGRLFRILPDGNGYSDILRTNYKPFGYSSRWNLTSYNDTLYGVNNLGGEFEHGCIFKMSKDGSFIDNLHNFNEQFVLLEQGELISIGNWLYGVSESGGINSCGYAYKIRHDGLGYQKIKEFQTTELYGPIGSLLFYNDSLYGASGSGGVFGKGCIFIMDTNGNGFRTLFSFKGASTGQNPVGSLVEYNSKLYGFAASSGASLDTGCVFRIDPDGSNFQNLHDFSGLLDGSSPRGKPEISSDGIIYGSTFMGGTYDYGTIFRINVDGTGFQKLHDMNGTDEMYGSNSLLLIDNKLFGTYTFDAVKKTGAIFTINTDGSGYKILHKLDTIDGINPFCGLIYSDSILYGITSNGGLYASGTVFRYGIKKTIPSIQSSGLYVNNITTVKADINWKNGNGIHHIVFLKEGSSGSDIPINKFSYNASSNWSSKGSQIGSSGFYCVYNGYDNKVNLTNLLSNNDYLVLVYDYNGEPGSEIYLTTISSENSKTFHTLTKADQQIVFDELPIKNLGDVPIVLSATASSGLSVSYSSNNPAIACIFKDTLTIKGIGTAIITASQAGNDGYNAAPDVLQTIYVWPVDLNSEFNNISISPNPAIDYITIKNTANKPLNIQISDMSGQTLIEQNLTGEQLNIQSLLPGMYMLKVDGAVFKLIKQ